MVRGKPARDAGRKRDRPADLSRAGGRLHSRRERRDERDRHRHSGSVHRRRPRGGAGVVTRCAPDRKSVRPKRPVELVRRQLLRVRGRVRAGRPAHDATGVADVGREDHRPGGTAGETRLREYDGVRQRVLGVVPSVDHTPSRREIVSGLRLVARGESTCVGVRVDVVERGQRELARVGLLTHSVSGRVEVSEPSLVCCTPRAPILDGTGLGPQRVVYRGDHATHHLGRDASADEVEPFDRRSRAGGGSNRDRRGLGATGAHPAREVARNWTLVQIDERIVRDRRRVRSGPVVATPHRVRHGVRIGRSVEPSGTVVGRGARDAFRPSVRAGESVHAPGRFVPANLAGPDTVVGRTRARQVG